tara:strand:- start:529 stop:1176 length:648 start_codon:yes stop_codon:yes gene_type:complete
MELTLEEAGAYSYIIDLMFDRGGKIPDDSQWIARVCGCSTRKFTSLKKRLVDAGKITVEKGYISNKKADDIIALNGHNENKTGLSEIYEADKSIIIEGEPPIINGLRGYRRQKTEDIKNKENNIKEKSSRKKPKTHIEPEWHPTMEGLTFARDKNFADKQIVDLAESYVDYYLAKGEPQADWNARWRTWVKNDIKYNGAPGIRLGGKRTKDQMAG